MTTKQETPTCAKGCGTYSISYNCVNNDIKDVKITCHPLTMKALLKINEDLYAELLRLNETVNKRVGYMEGQFEAIVANQKTLYASISHLEKLVWTLKKPWWKRFLGM